MEQSSLFISYLRVTQHMSQQFRSHFGRMDLTFPQAMVLTVLGEDGPVPISTLAERTGSANSTVSGIVDRLEKLGLAKRQRSETDRRREVRRAAGQGGHRCEQLLYRPDGEYAGGGPEAGGCRPPEAGRGVEPGGGKGKVIPDLRGKSEVSCREAEWL